MRILYLLLPVLLASSLLLPSAFAEKTEQSEGGSPQFLLESRALPVPDVAGRSPAPREVQYETRLLGKDELLVRQVEALKQIQTQLNRELEEQKQTLKQAQEGLMRSIKENTALHKKVRDSERQSALLETEEVDLRAEIIQSNRQLNRVMQDYEALRRTNSSLNNQLQLRQKENEAIVGQVQMLEARNLSLDREMKGQIQTTDQSLGDLQATQAEIRELKEDSRLKQRAYVQEIENLKYELEAMRSEQNQSLQSQGSLQSQFQEARENADLLTKQVQALNDRNVRAQVEFDEKEAELLNHIQAVQLKLQAKIREWEAGQKVNQALRDEIDNAERRNSELVARVEQSKQAQSDLNQKLESVLQKKGLKAQDFDAIRAQLAKAQGESQDLRKEITRLTSYQKDMEQQIRETSTDKRLAHAHAAEMREHMEALESSKATMEQNIANLTSVRDQLKRELADLDQGKQKAEQTIKRLQTTIESKAKVNEKLNLEIKELSEAQVNLRTELTRVQGEHAASERQVRALEARLDAGGRQKNDLVDQLDAARAKYEAFQATQAQTAQEQSEQIEKYERQVATAKADKHDLEQHLAIQKASLKQSREVMMKGMRINAELYENAKKAETQLNQAITRANESEAELAKEKQASEMLIKQNSKLTENLSKAQDGFQNLDQKYKQNQVRSNELVAELERAQDEVRAVERQRSDLEQAQARLRAELASAIEKSQQDTQANRAAQRELSELTQSTSDLTRELKKLTNQKTALDATLQNKVTTIDGLLLELQEAKDARSQLERDLTQAKQSVDQIQRLARDSRNTLQQRLATLEEKVSESNRDLGVMKERNRSLMTRVQDISNQLDEKTKAFQSLKTELVELENSRETLRGRLEATLSEMSTLRAENKTLTEVSNQVKSLTLSENQLKEDIARLQGLLKSRATEVENLSKAKRDLEYQLLEKQKLERDLQDVRMVRAQIEAERDSLKKHLKKALNENWEAIKTAEDLKKDLDQTRQYVTNLRAELSKTALHRDSISSELTGRRQKMHQMNMNREIATQSLRQTMADYQDARGEVAKLEDKLASNQLRAAELKGHLEERTQQLKDAQTESLKVRQDLTEMTDESNRLNGLLKEVREAHQAELEKIVSLKDTVDQKDQAMRDAQAKYETRIHVLTNRSANLDAEIQELKQVQTQLTQDKESLNRTLDEQGEEIVLIKANEVRLASQLDEKFTRLRKLRSEHDRLAKTYGRMMEAHAGISRTLQILDEQTEHQMRDIQSLQGELKEEHASKAALKNDLERWVDTSSKEKHKLISAHKSLETERNALQVTLADALAKQKLEAVKAHEAQAALEKQLQLRQQELEAQIKKMGLQAKELSELRMEGKSLKESLKSLKDSSERMQIERDQYKSTLDLTNEEYEKAVKDRALLEIQLGSIKRNQERLKTEFNELQMDALEGKDAINQIDQSQATYESRIRKLKMQNSELRDHLKQIDYIVENTDGSNLRKNLVTIQSYSPTSQDSE